MPTSLDTSFMNGQAIDADDVKQFAEPINDLESGAAVYRQDTGSANAYQVDFSDSDENGISALSPGLVIRFKAANANTGASTLTVAGTGGSLGAVPLKKNGSFDLESNDIKAGQMVVAIYNSAGGGRFEVMGGVAEHKHDADDITSGTLGVARGGTGLSSFTAGDLISATGAAALGKVGIGSEGQILKVVSGSPAWQAESGAPASLDDLGDVVASSPSDGDVLAFDSASSDWESVPGPVSGIYIFSVGARTNLGNGGAARPVNMFRTTFSSITADSMQDSALVCTGPGTVRNLRVELRANTLTTANTTVTVYKNGSATDVSVTLAAGVTQGNDLTNTVSVSAGDKIVVVWETDSGGSGSAADLNASVEIAI